LRVHPKLHLHHRLRLPGRSLFESKSDLLTLLG
jgi:hypothetical protein